MAFKSPTDELIQIFAYFFCSTVLYSSLFCQPQHIDSNSSPGPIPDVYQINFGDEEETVLQSVYSNHGWKPTEIINRDEYRILVFNQILTSNNYVDQLNIYISVYNGVFCIEEEFHILWNHQLEERENVNKHQTRFRHILTELRKKYGKEIIYKPVDFLRKYPKNNFVTATWRFYKNQWIHFFFEPQDWSIKPELNKFIIIYRDSDLDTR